MFIDLGVCMYVYRCVHVCGYTCVCIHMGICGEQGNLSSCSNFQVQLRMQCQNNIISQQGGNSPTHYSQGPTNKYHLAHINVIVEPEH